MNFIIILFLALLLLLCTSIAVFLIVRTLIVLYRDKESIHVMNVQLDDLSQRISSDEEVSGQMYDELNSNINTTRLQNAVMTSNIKTNVTSQKYSIGRTGSNVSLDVVPASNGTRGVGTGWLYLNNSSNLQFANFGVGSLLVDNGISITKGSCVDFDNGASMCGDRSSNPNMRLQGNLLFGQAQYSTGGVTSSNINGTRMFTQFASNQSSADVRLGFTSSSGTVSDAMVITQNSVTNKNTIRVLGSLMMCDETGSNCNQPSFGLTGVSYLMKVSGKTLTSMLLKTDLINSMTLSCFVSNFPDTTASPPNSIFQIDTSITVAQMNGFIARLKALDNYNCSDIVMIPSYLTSAGRNPYPGTIILPQYPLPFCA